MDWNANFTEICRCCSRMESGMTSIFDGNAHSAYPPVDEMLNKIACLNIQKHDGLPSLVCTLCVNNIQDAYTFLLQLTEIDAQLWHMLLARKAQAETLPQGFAHMEAEDTLLKNIHVIEDVKYSLAVENLDDAMQNSYHESANNPVPETEEANKFQIKQEQCEDVSNLACDLSNKPRENSSGNNFLIPIHANSNDSADQDADTTENNVPEEEKKSEVISPKLRATFRTEENKSEVISPKLRASFPTMIIGRENPNTFTLNDNDPLLKVQAIEGLEDLDDIVDKGADKVYQKDNSADFSDNEYDPYCKGKKSRKIPLNTQTKPAAKVEHKRKVFKCKLCACTSGDIVHLKRHLRKHLNDQRFACTKCNRTFATKCNIQHHWQTCKGIDQIRCQVCKSRPKFSSEESFQTHNLKFHGGNASKTWIVVTLKDIKDPLKMKKYYYTVTKSNNVKVKSVKKSGEIVQNGVNKNMEIKVLHCQ